MRKTAGLALVVAAALGAAACDSEGVSTVDVERAAEARVIKSLGLSEDAAVFADVFVGGEAKGDRVVCGTVSGTRADGTAITPRRFIAAIEPARWLTFEPVTNSTLPSQPDKFVEWEQACGAEAREG